MIFQVESLKPFHPISKEVSVASCFPFLLAKWQKMSYFTRQIIKLGQKQGCFLTSTQSYIRQTELGPWIVKRCKKVTCSYFLYFHVILDITKYTLSAELLSAHNHFLYIVHLMSKAIFMYQFQTMKHRMDYEIMMFLDMNANLTIICQGKIVIGEDKS